MGALPFQPGDLIAGRFFVERLLGRGGMGAVFAAEDRELGRRVAIKVMLDYLASDPGIAERFHREAKAAVKLESPHAARVFDFGRADGVAYIVMEYLDGVDLSTRVREGGPLKPEVAGEYIRQACEALGEAHRAGIVHRDVKLRNLFLTRGGQVKVLDFGIAKGGDAGDIELTATGTSGVVGSAEYLSPEQLRAFASADARSDVWSLGVCLYELVTGHVPFEAPSIAEVCAKVLNEAPTPLGRWVTSCPSDLERIIARCLDKHPRGRFEDARELGAALGAVRKEVAAPTTVPRHPNEEARLAALRRYRILDTPPEDDFELLAEIAAALCEAPLAFVTLVDEQRVWYKAWHGVDASALEMARDDDYCSWAILEETLLEIPDVAQDPRTAKMTSTVSEPHLRMYCGANLLTPEGLPIGTLCVVDTVARALTDDQHRLLTRLARQVMSLLELRATLAEVRRLTRG